MIDIDGLQQSLSKKALVDAIRRLNIPKQTKTSGAFILKKSNKAPINNQ
jgi:hypothetical protein